LCTQWQGCTELHKVFTCIVFICPGKVADTASTYKYKMQLKGDESGVVQQGEEPEELSGEYSGVNVSVSDPNVPLTEMENLTTQSQEGVTTQAAASDAALNQSSQNVVEEEGSEVKEELPPQNEDVGEAA